MANVQNSYLAFGLIDITLPAMTPQCFKNKTQNELRLAFLVAGGLYLIKYLNIVYIVCRYVVNIIINCVCEKRVLYRVLHYILSVS